MQISFDLDGTLIPYNNEFPTEKRSWWAKLLGIEPIRKGTKTLIKTLQSQGNEVIIQWLSSAEFSITDSDGIVTRVRVGN